MGNLQSLFLFLLYNIIFYPLCNDHRTDTDTDTSTPIKFWENGIIQRNHKCRCRVMCFGHRNPPSIRSVNATNGWMWKTIMTFRNTHTSLWIWTSSGKLSFSSLKRKIINAQLQIEIVFIIDLMLTCDSTIEDNSKQNLINRTA